MKTKTILITGAAGFIGFHLAEALLHKGYRVVGVDSLTDYYDVRMKNRRLELLKKYPKFSFYKQSILEYEKLVTLMKRARVTDIYHLAAQPGVRYSVSHPRSYGENNYVGTLNVFEAAHTLRIRRVVYASSSTVYGMRKGKGAFSETDRVDAPLSVYGATKVANEALGHAYANAYGMQMIGIRFFTVYGAYGRPDLGLFIFTKRILEGKTLSLFNYGKTRRAFTHISDVIPPLVRILKKPIRNASRIYNIGGTQSISLIKLLTHIEKAARKRAKVKLTAPIVGDMPETIADCRKAKKDLGYRPKMNIEKGVKEFVTWYRANEGWLTTLTEPKS